MITDWDGIEEVVAIADAGTFTGGSKLLGPSSSQMTRIIARQFIGFMSGWGAMLIACRTLIAQCL